MNRRANELAGHANAPYGPSSIDKGSEDHDLNQNNPMTNDEDRSLTTPSAAATNNTKDEYFHQQYRSLNHTKSSQTLTRPNDRFLPQPFPKGWITTLSSSFMEI